MSNRRAFASFLLLLLFIILPPGLFWVDLFSAEYVQRTQEAEKHRDVCRRTLEDLSRSTDNEVQLRVLLERFQEELTRAAEKMDARNLNAFARETYERDLKPNLPVHDLAWFSWRNGGLETVLEADGGLGYVPNLVREFLADILKVAITPRGEIWTGRTSKWQWIRRIALSKTLSGQELGSALGKCFQFAFRPEFLTCEVIMGLHVFNSLDGQRGLYTQTFPRIINEEIPPKNILSVLMDLKRLPRDFSRRMIFRSYRRRQAGVGFFPLDGGRPLLSPYWRRIPGVLPEVRRELTGTMGEFWDFESFKHRVVMSDRAISGGYRMVLVEPVPDFPWTSISLIKPKIALVVSLMALGMWLLWRIHIRQREPRLAISLVLLGTFITGTLPFLSGIQAIARLTMFEASHREIQEAGRDLQRQLVSFEASAAACHSRIFATIRRRCGLPETGRLFYQEERSATDTQALDRVILKILRDIPWTTRMALNGVAILSGPGEYFRRYSCLAKETNQDSVDLSQGLLPIARKSRNVFLEEAGIPSGEEESDGKVSKHAIEFEMVRDHLLNMLGAETWLKLLYQPWRLVVLRMNIGRITMFNSVVELDGKARYLIFWLWDELLAYDGIRMLFETLPPPSQKEAYFMSFSREESFKSVPEGIGAFPELATLIQRARDTGQTMRKTIVEKGRREVMEVVRSPSVSESHFAGMRQVADTTEVIRNRLWQTILVLILLVLLVSAWAVNFFTRPFNAILEAIRKFRPEDQPLLLAEAARPDEFGTLAGAFNGMQKGLRERELLGQYVSGSVRRLVQDADFQKSAQEGMLREVTVVFTGLYQFEEFQEKAEPEAVYRVLDEHLAVVSGVVADLGGEVSKVIGEKLLIVFDHSEFPTPEEAVQAAVLASLLLRTRLQGLPLSPITGINTGEVIAGIIGSPDVRRDYTVIGDTVNLASRLATLAYVTEDTRLVISGKTRELLGEAVMTEKLPFKRVKGKTQEVEAFLVKSSSA
jgi:class 3 adenylate cyclase